MFYLCFVYSELPTSKKSVEYFYRTILAFWSIFQAFGVFSRERVFQKNILEYFASCWSILVQTKIKYIKNIPQKHLTSNTKAVRKEYPIFSAMLLLEETEHFGLTEGIS